jgi:CrcB protein
MKQLLYIGIGGFIGSIFRFLVARLNLSVQIFSIPVGTFIVNLLGSMIIGFLAGVASKSELMSPNLRLFLMVGICGGFTTFSSFTLENMTLLQNGQYVSAIIYILSSFIFGLVAVFTGYFLSNLIH